MLTQRDEYKLVKIPYDIQINGQVMPTREVDKVIYGEDICWLSERMNRWITGSGQYYAGARNWSIDKRIIGSRYKNIIEWMKYTANQGESHSGKFLNPSAKWETFYEFVWSQSEVYFSPIGLNKDAALPSSVFESDSSDFDTGKPLKKKPINTLFSDFKKWNSVQAYWWANGMDGYTYDCDNHDSKGVVPSRRKPSGTMTFYYIASDGGEYVKSGDNWHWVPDWYYRLYTLKADAQKDAEYIIDFSSRQYMASTATVFLEFNSWARYHTTPVDNDGIQRQESISHNYIFPVTCSKSDYGYTIPYQAIQYCTNQIVARRGWNSPNPGGYSSNGTSGVTEAYVTPGSTMWSVLRLNDEMDYD